MTTTAEATAFWTAPRADAFAWMQQYQQSADRDDRRQLAEAMRPYAPFASVFEVGCHCGPVLEHLRRAFGPFRYSGLDVNGSALDYGRFWSKRLGYGDDARWFYGSILDSDLRQVPDRSEDVVLSASCLMYISPADLREALHTMARMADRLVIIQEPQEERHEGGYHQWAHDYRRAWDVPGFRLSGSDDLVIAERT